MASPKSQLSIHAAQMNCLAGCIESNTPLTFFIDFQEKLRLLGWRESDVEAVANAVFPVLTSYQTDQAHDGFERKMTAS